MRHELILGGAKSGKSRTAEGRAARWLAGGSQRRATLVATALPGDITGDTDMQRRIARHRADRAMRVPQLQTLEAADALGHTLAGLSDPQHLVVVDCLTLWLTQRLMPARQDHEQNLAAAQDGQAPAAMLIEAIERCPGPLVLVGNEIGLGVIPLGREVRAFVDALGALNQAVAAACRRVTLMAAGLPLTLKEGAP